MVRSQEQCAIEEWKFSCWERYVKNEIKHDDQLEVWQPMGVPCKTFQIERFTFWPCFGVEFFSPTHYLLPWSMN